MASFLEGMDGLMFFLVNPGKIIFSLEGFWWFEGLLFEDCYEMEGV